MPRADLWEIEPVKDVLLAGTAEPRAIAAFAPDLQSIHQYVLTAISHQVNSTGNKYSCDEILERTARELGHARDDDRPPIVLTSDVAH